MEIEEIANQQAEVLGEQKKLIEELVEAKDEAVSKAHEWGYKCIETQKTALAAVSALRLVLYMPWAVRLMFLFRGTAWLRHELKEELRLLTKAVTTEKEREEWVKKN